MSDVDPRDEQHASGATEASIRLPNGIGDLPSAPRRPMSAPLLPLPEPPVGPSDAPPPRSSLPFPLPGSTVGPGVVPVLSLGTPPPPPSSPASSSPASSSPAPSSPASASPATAAATAAAVTASGCRRFVVGTTCWAAAPGTCLRRQRRQGRPNGDGHQGLRAAAQRPATSSAGDVVAALSAGDHDDRVHRGGRDDGVRHRTRRSGRCASRDRSRTCWRRSSWWRGACVRCSTPIGSYRPPTTTGGRRASWWPCCGASRSPHRSDSWRCSPEPVDDSTTRTATCRRSPSRCSPARSRCCSCGCRSDIWPVRRIASARQGARVVLWFFGSILAAAGSTAIVALGLRDMLDDSGMTSAERALQTAVVYGVPAFVFALSTWRATTVFDEVIDLRWRRWRSEWDMTLLELASQPAPGPELADTRT